MVINTLIVSLFVYKMTVLPFMAPELISQLEHSMNDFLWNSRKPKIPIYVLQQPKGKGGLNLVNFRIKDRALKAAWVKLIKTDDMISQCAYKMLHTHVGESIWECNLNKRDIRKMFKPSFWRDVLEAWADVNYSEPSTVKQILKQCIWYNSKIKIGGNVIIWKNVYDAGLRKIEQFYDRNGNIIPHNEMQRIYRLSVMQYNGVLSAIPNTWKNKIKSEFGNKQDDKGLYTKFVNSANCMKLYKEIIAEDSNVLQAAYKKWENEAKMTVDFDDFSVKFRALYMITNQAKLRSFQYRLLHRAVVLNDRLFRWKIVESNVCTFCKKHKENIYHFFWECEIAQTTWMWVRDICKNIREGECAISYENIVMNCIHTNPAHVYNFVLLVAKQYLYATRCKKEPPVKKILENKVEMCRRYELYYAIQQNTVDKHVKKWCQVVEGKIKQNSSGLEDEFIKNYVIEK